MAHPISLIFCVFKEGGVFFFLVNVDLDPLQTGFSFVCSQSIFYFIIQISFCLSVKYVCFCSSCPNWACAVIASFFLVDNPLNVENSSFSALHLL